MTHEPQRFTDLQITFALWASVAVTLLVLPPLVFPESRTKSKLQTLGYVLSVLAWPLFAVGAMFYWAFCLARCFWNLPMIERTPE